MVYSKNALLSRHIFNLLRRNFLKIAEMIDAIVEKKIKGGCRDRLFAIKMIHLKKFWLCDTYLKRFNEIHRRKRLKI